MKLLRSTLLVLMSCWSIMAFATAGDTTVVYTSPLLNADYSANFDSMMVLPTGITYRKIFLIYTVNSHACPAGSTYCHQWDYLGNVVLKSPHGDTVELARIITPFATSGWARFPAPPAWFEDYVFDVTDFAPYLQDTITVHSALGVGSPGFGIRTKLIFIEGTPDRNIVAIHPIYATGSGWNGGTYGNATSPINNHFPIVNETAPAGTVSAAFRNIVTGHGSDANYCCEFDRHYYDVILNTDTIQRQYVWRTCGTNELYPQGGTWLYDRSNWCPGSSVLPYYHPLPGITAGSNYNINIAFEPYTVTSPSGNYHTGTSVVYYGGMNKTLDASIEDIIAPSASPQHFRENPSSNLPTIHIHNSGSTAISSVDFQYGVIDSALQTYSWSGALAPLADTVISLPASISIAAMTAASKFGTFPFKVAITGVNGTPDVDQTNDTMWSQFVVAPKWPDTIIVKMLTSNLGADGMNINVNPSDASWYIMDVNGDTVFSRTNTDYSTLYMDTLVLPANGYYKFLISTPAWCSGLHYWANDMGFTGYAPGYLQIRKPNGSGIPMHGYTYTGATTPAALKDQGAHDDFGCEFSQYFYVSSVIGVGVPGIKNNPSIVVYPNPANEEINVEFGNINTNGSSVSVINILGQKVYTGIVSAGNVKVNTRNFAPGLYTILYNTPGGSSNIGKVMVAH